VPPHIQHHFFAYKAEISASLHKTAVSTWLMDILIKSAMTQLCTGKCAGDTDLCYPEVVCQD
jgi:hypothetical protein